MTPEDVTDLDVVESVLAHASKSAEHARQFTRKLFSPYRSEDLLIMLPAEYADAASALTKIELALEVLRARMTAPEEG